MATEDLCDCERIRVEPAGALAYMVNAPSVDWEVHSRTASALPRCRSRIPAAHRGQRGSRGGVVHQGRACVGNRGQCRALMPLDLQHVGLLGDRVTSRDRVELGALTGT